MLLRNALPLLTLSILCACRLSASGIDLTRSTISRSWSGSAGFAASGPFASGSQNTACSITLPSRQFRERCIRLRPSDYELDSLTGTMNAEFYLNGVDEGDWLVPYEADTVLIGLSALSYRHF